MSTLLEGADGIVQVGPSNALTDVGYVTKFEVECKTEMKSKGPWIGNAVKQRVRGGKESSGTLEADIPEGRDPGQTALLGVHEGGTNLRLVLRGGDSTGGYTYTAAAAGIESVKFGGDAAEGYTFSFAFVDMTGYTLIPSA